MDTQRIKCPHGIVCDYVYTYTTIDGERYVTGGDYWHDEDTKCTKEADAQRELDDDLIDYARSQWDGRKPRTEYDR